MLWLAVATAALLTACILMAAGYECRHPQRSPHASTIVVPMLP